MRANTAVRNSAPYRMMRLLTEYVAWARRDFAAPSPHHIKQSCLLRNGLPNATWVETGTYLGETTRILSKNSLKVYSIEPEPTLFTNAKHYFANFKNVEILNGTSEEVFPRLLPTINGRVNFWLDGHYSAGLTFKGKQDTPVLEELENIAQNLVHFEKVCVLVDDIRCFSPNIKGYETYPPLNALVAWAEKYHLAWHIEQDIFIAKN